MSALATGAFAIQACSGKDTADNDTGDAGSTSRDDASKGGGGTTGDGNASVGGRAATGGSNAAGGSQSTGGSAAVGGASNAGGSSTGTGTEGTAAPARICDEPTPWPPPSTNRVVGTGSAESCTASALSSAISGGGNVTFDCGAEPVTIGISSAIQVTKATVVDGQGRVTLDGGGRSQIFVVSSNNSLSVRGLRFIGGKAPEDTEAAGIGGAVSGNWRSKVEVIGCTFEDNVAARGGGAVAVWTGSSLTIVSSRFLRNVSWYGGAVYSLLSPLTIVNSEFVDNSTTLQKGFGDGGAIGTDGASESPNDSIGGTIEICGSEIRNNKGNGSGGGAYIWMYPPDTAIIDRTTIANNDVVKNASGQGSIGGGMRISNGEITIRDSSLLSNTSIGNGGGLYLDCAPSCTIANSTFFANKNTAGWGGAIFSGTTSGKFLINNSTFANNAQQGTSGNAFFGSATWGIHNSVFLDNGCANKGTGANVLQWSTTSKNAGSGPCINGVVAKDPLLSAPADNGGPTDTMLPGTGSGVLQAGTSCEEKDQRGEPRNSATCDLGSVEVP
ncbi:MAG: choice-of-anchor Q domain-containing protein [Polyangiaceae bacterium]